MKNKIILLALFYLMFISCATSSRSYYVSSPSKEMRRYVSVEDGIIGNDLEGRSPMVTYSARIGIKLKEIDSVLSDITDIAKANKGYLVSSSSGSVNIRVKAENLHIALEDISKLGKVEWKNLSSNDVTSKYKDDQIRLSNAQEARKRYLKLLEQAENVEAALKVEVELERLSETIELLKGKMNKMSYDIEYSTIYVSFQQKHKPGILGYIGLGLYKSVKWLFVRG